MKSVFSLLAEAEANGDAVALCMIVESHGSTPRRSGSKMLVYPDGQISGSVGGGELESRVIETALGVLKTGVPITLEYSMADPKRGDPGVCGGSLKVFIEPILPPPTVVVAGAGHVGRAVAFLAKWLGYRVVVTDDRPEYCTPEAVPGCDQYLPIPLAELTNKLMITPHTFLILTTRNVTIDVAGLPDLLKSQAAYIGIIGSRRRWATTKNLLLEQGIPDESLDRVISPMGLELNSETPEEIALSIMAEITMLRYGGDGKRMISRAK